MSKLEEKLVELGYENRFVKNVWEKHYNQNLTLKINLKTLNGRVFTSPLYAFKSQQDIDNLQQAFNTLQQDLEVLKEYENKKIMGNSLKSLWIDEATENFKKEVKENERLD